MLLPGGASDWTASAPLWLVVALSLGATTLLMQLANRGPVSDTASLFFLLPAASAVVAGITLGERITWPTLLGRAVTTAGVALATRGRRAATQPAPVQSIPRGTPVHAR